MTTGADTGVVRPFRSGPSLAYLAAFTLVVIVGRMLVPEGTVLPVFWPAAGVAGLWMLRGSTRAEVALDGALLLLSTVVVTALFGAALPAALLFGLANLVQGSAVRLVFAWARGRQVDGRLDPEVRRLRDLWRLGLSSLLAALVSAPLGLAAAVVDSESGAENLVVAWVVRDLCGAFVVMATFLTVRSAVRFCRLTGCRPIDAVTPERRPHAAVELALSSVLSLLVALVVFTGTNRLPLAWLLIAIPVWVGFRFAPAVGALHALGLGTLAVIFSVLGNGPFGEVADPVQQAILLQLFVTAIALVTLTLSLEVAERSDLTERLRASEAQARARAQLLDAITDTMTDGLAVLDSTDAVVLSNPAAALLAGSVEGNDRARSPESHGVFALDGTPLASADRPHVRALRGETVAAMDLLRIDPTTGKRSMLSVTAIPLSRPDSDGGPLAVLTVRDVTTARDRTRELQSYAGVVAHDLKNPLFAVKGWAEILDGQLDTLEGDKAQARMSLVRIHASAERMQTLIGDLLDYSRAQSAVLQLEHLSLDELVDEYAGELAADQPALVTAIERAALDPVRADATLVRQLFGNVLGNAVKYVAEGTCPHVQVSSRSVGDMVEVRVLDNGIGISGQDRGRIFDSFYRSAAAEEFPGTGLGLSISSRAIERHGGRIWAEARDKGAGTAICFTLPADPAPHRNGSETAVG